MPCGCWTAMIASGGNRMDSGVANKNTDEGVTFLAFNSRQEASTALADEIESTLAEMLSQKPVANLVVSGGTSPVAFFHSLRTRNLAWSLITVMPSDERVVPAGHPDRNDAMIKRELLVDAASNAHLQGLLPCQDAAEQAGSRGSATSAFDAPDFDSVVLGMGDDGHTASLFPDSPTIETALLSTESTTRVTVPRLKAERISLTPAALLNTRRIDLLFFGQDKREVFEAAMAPGPASTYPVRVVLHQDRVPVRVFWAP